MDLGIGGKIEIVRGGTGSRTSRTRPSQKTTRRNRSKPTTMSRTA